MRASVRGGETGLLFLGIYPYVEWIANPCSNGRFLWLETDETKRESFPKVFCHHCNHLYFFLLLLSRFFVGETNIYPCVSSSSAPVPKSP